MHKFLTGKAWKSYTAQFPNAATKQFGGVNAILLNLRYSICYAHLRISGKKMTVQFNIPADIDQLTGT